MKNNQLTQLLSCRTTNSHSSSHEEQTAHTAPLMKNNHSTQLFCEEQPAHTDPHVKNNNSHSSSHEQQPAHTAPNVKDNQSTQLLILLHICSLRSTACQNDGQFLQKYKWWITGGAVIAAVATGGIALYMFMPAAAAAGAGAGAVAAGTASSGTTAASAGTTTWTISVTILTLGIRRGK